LTATAQLFNKNTWDSESQDTTKKRVVVLSNLLTTVSAHKLTAWMGPIGIGKTSLLSAASGSADENNLILSSVIPVKWKKIAFQSDWWVSCGRRI
jgi:ABC-type nitrate/sulfonate/bicarbonate transport system ATPase subunit